MRPLLIGVALVSAASVMLQVVLTRIFSIVQWYHFAFMAVGLGLLGYGVSGTVLAVRVELGRDPLRTAAWGALLVLPATGLALLAIAGVPFDAYLMALDPLQILYLAVVVGALVLPFFCAGLTVGATLAALPARAGSVYAASFVGGGAGALGAVLLLGVLDAEGSVIAAAAVATAGSALLWWGRHPRGVASAALLALLTAIAAPAAPDLPASPYKALNQVRRHPGARIAFSASNAISKVDVVQSATVRSAPGLSYMSPHVPPSLPGLTIDNESLRGLPANVDAEFTRYLPTAAAYRLRPGRALVLGLGVEVLGALRHGMRPVVVVESNPLVVEAARAFAGDVIGPRPATPAPSRSNDPVQIIVENPRTYLRRTPDLFEVIQVPPLESFQVVASGTFSLAEHYLHTVEAFRDLLSRLGPGGVLAVTRWIQTPPSEEIKAWAAAVAALEAIEGQRSTAAARGDSASRLMALRSLNTMTVLVKPDGFSPDDVSAVQAFAAARRFDITFGPAIDVSESNRYNVQPADLHRQAFLAVLDPATREGFLRAYPFDVRPVTDTRPFFFHFFRWHQVPRVLATLGRTWQPFGGGGYLVLIALLVIIAALSAALILAPLRRLELAPTPARPGSQATSVPRMSVFAYFLALGLAYLFVEIPMLQQMILVLGSPTYALSAVLCGLLVTSGLGSLLAPRLSRGLPGVTLVLAVGAALAAWLLPRILNASLGMVLPARVVLLAAILTPLGLFMGMPFPTGIRALGKTSPSLIPWAWGINGCASVLGSIAAVLIALEWGFPAVLLAGALAYAAAGLTARTGAWLRPSCTDSRT
ncbi:MAG: spermidine synthase [Armatimonadota bacterium]